MLEKLSYSNVVATLALFIALTGGVVMAAGLTKNSVKSKHIKDGQVRTQDIGDGEVTGADLGPGSVGSGAVADDAIGSSEILGGAVGTSEIAPGAVGTAEQAPIPAARVRKSSSTAIADTFPPTPTIVTLDFDLESGPALFDTGGLHDPASAARLTAPVSGIYHVEAQVQWANDADDDVVKRRLRLSVDNATTVAAANDTDQVGTSATAQQISTDLQLAAGQFVTVSAEQDNTDDDTLSIDSASAFSPVFEMIWLGPA